MDKLHVIQMPETDVRLIVPGEIEVFCMAHYKKGSKEDFECCKLGSGAIEYSFPLMAFVDGLSKLEKHHAKVAASFAIREIAKAAGIGIVEMETNMKNPEDIANSLQGIFENGGEQE